jgi:putative membrane protein
MTRLMKTLGALLGAAGLLALSATAAAAQSTNPAPQDGMTTQQKPIQTSRATADYVEKAAIGNLFEIQSSALALKQADSSAVKTFAQQMITDHTNAGKALEAGVTSASQQATQIPNKLDKAHEAKLNDLRKMTGRDFDAAYIKAQLAGHQEALKLHRDYAQKGDNAVLKKTAANAADITEHHLQTLQQISQAVPPQTSSTGNNR